MQRPTCTGIRIRSTQDAHKIFYAVQRKMLPLLTRRLDADERLALGTGCVYVWEERGPHTEMTGLGIERFTEGRRWSQSRVRDEFLFYYERYTTRAEAAAQYRYERQPPQDWDPLVKQTYSVWTDTDNGRKKWHLTAYFTQRTVDDLGTVDDISTIRDLVVPPGRFLSTRNTAKSRRYDDPHGRGDDMLRDAASPSSSRSYGPYASPTTPLHEPPPLDTSSLSPADQERLNFLRSNFDATKNPPPNPDTRYASSSPTSAYYPGFGPASHDHQQRPYDIPFGSPSSHYSRAGSERVRDGYHLPPLSPAVMRRSDDYGVHSSPRPADFSPPMPISYARSGYSPDDNRLPPLDPSHTQLYYKTHDSQQPQDVYSHHGSPEYDDDDSISASGRSRVGLAPLSALQRNHPYRRDPADDKALRSLIHSGKVN